MRKIIFFLILTCAVNGVLAQVCAPAYSSVGSGAGEVKKVNMTGTSGTSISDLLTSGTLSSGYADHYLSVAAVQVFQGASYTMLLQYFSAAPNTGNQVWVDFNDDNVFADSEAVSEVRPGTYDFWTSTSSVSLTINIPNHAAPGFHRMRVRNVNYNLSTTPGYGSDTLSPCNNSDATNSYLFGVTVDYQIKIVTPTACTLFAGAGTAIGPSSICPGMPFDVTVVGDSVMAGLSYQWWAKPDGGIPAVIPGATDRNYHVPDQTIGTTYQLYVTCSGGITTTSVSVYVSENPFFRCYCSALLGGDPNDVTIDSVSIIGTTFNNYTPGNHNIYTQFLDTGSATAILNKGATYGILIRSFGYSAYKTGIWIDYDQDGTYAPSEYTSIGGSTGGGQVVNSFSIPSTAMNGNTGLRVRTVISSTTLGSGDACAHEFTGETEDYVIYIADPTTCSGAPFTGPATSTMAYVCPGQAFSVIAPVPGVTSDMTFQWYSSPAGLSTFSAISGATNSTYNISSQTVATDYRLVATCPSGPFADTSTIVTVGESPSYACYCGPSTGIDLDEVTNAAPLDSVAISSTTLADYTPGSTIPYILNYPSTPTTTGNIVQGNYYTIWVKSLGSSNYNAGVWIDYNQDGIYQSSEYNNIATNIAAGATTPLTFLIPASAAVGATGMRVRVTDAGTTLVGTDACTTEFNGATHDYIIHILPSGPCSGAPLTGVITCPVSEVCPSQPFMLSLSVVDFGAGITYQWLSRPAGSGAFTPISGATVPTYTVSSQTAATDYRVKLTCSGGSSDTTLSITINEKPFYTCYCNSVTGSVLNDSVARAPIDSVSILGTTLNNNTPGSVALYTQYYPTTSSTTATLNQGGTYVMAVKSTGTSSYYLASWIDYNHNGVFDSPEFIAISSASAAGTSTIATFTVPATSDTGLTGLRVRTVAYPTSVGTTDACTEFVYGATQDYVINIHAATSCSGIPVAGVANSTSAQVCNGETFTVSASGYSTNPGITFQWIKANTGSSTFTAISGATSLLYTISNQAVSTDYALVSHCSGGGTDTSVRVTVLEKAFYRCYCSPTTDTALSLGATTTPIDSVSIAGTTLHNITPTGTGIYTLYYPTATSTTATLFQGDTYNVSVNSNGTSNYNAGMWIDANHNGQFDPSEYTILGLNIPAGMVCSGSILIASGADTGLTGMRIRTSTFSTSVGASDACSSESEGSTQDYIVNLSAGIVCSGTPVAGTAYATTATICPLNPFLVIDTAYSTGLSLSYQWYSRPATGGAFTAIAGATNHSYSIASQTVSTQYRFVVTCAVGATTDSSNIITVTETPYTSCYCGGVLGTSGASTHMNIVHSSGSGLNLSVTDTSVHRIFAMVGDSTGVFQKTLPYGLSLNVSGGTNFNAGMWIDTNHNGIFEPSEYFRLDTNAISGVTTLTNFTIASGADTGVTGMRIRAVPATTTFGSGDACTNFTNSQTYDLQIRIIPLSTCSGTPVAGTITSSSPFACPAMTVYLSEDGYTVGSGMSFQWIKRNTGSTTFTAITGATSHYDTITSQIVATDYAVVAHCLSGGYDTSNILTITENPFDSCYCSPPTGIPIFTAAGDTEIIINSIPGTTMYNLPYPNVATGYVSVPPTLSSATATLQRGSTYGDTIYVNCPMHTFSSAGMWIDLNHSGTFDAGENFAMTESADHSHWRSIFTVPSSATLGLTGMRIMILEGGAVSSACGIYPHGEVVDYIINITAPPCFSISSESITNITDSTAVGHWGALAGTAGYEYVLNTTPSAPTGAGTPTTDTFMYSGCLMSGTMYYLHVRDSCGPGTFSSWTTVNFTTLTCGAETGLTTSSLTDHAATIHWHPVAGSDGYEYVINTTASAPAGSGTALSDTTTSASGLTQGTIYYAHVRNTCGCGNHSAWQTISFTTICDTLLGLHVANINDTGATIIWDSVIGMSSYQYVVNTTATAPTGSGTALTDSSVAVTGLTPGVTYYAHVRHMCSGGSSSWVTVPFTTNHCDTVSALSTTATDTSVVVSWGAVAGTIGYYYVIDHFSTPPSGGGVFTTSTSVSINGLLSSVMYYIHVRSSCGGGYSAWETISFTTFPCDTVIGLSATGISDTGAILSWIAAASGGLGYLYVINTTPSTPGITGTFTTGTTINLNALTPGTTYYIHVRHLCSAIDTSAWGTLGFTTHLCDTVGGLAITGISDTGAIISWPLISGAPGYTYVLNSSASTPTSGTYTTTNTFTATTLLPGTTYWVHIMVNCGAGHTSAWINVPFTTLTCDTPAVTISAITAYAATVSWASMPGMPGYEYVVDNSASSPTAAGTATAGTSYGATGLTPMTTYYAHVRVSCGGGMYSAWVNVPFTTTTDGVQVQTDPLFHLQAFPNPVTEMLTIKVAGRGTNARLMVTDITGKAVVITTLDADDLEIDLTKYASGMYFIKYEDDSHVTTIKLNKQ